MYRSKWPSLALPQSVTCLLLASLLTSALDCQKVRVCAASPSLQSLAADADERKIAERHAPIFYQGLGDQPRNDYLTNFDFDGDWRGDNNWHNADNQAFPLNAYVYYAISETLTHYFIHYAVFHPIDYKGGKRKGEILSSLIREGVKISGKFDPTGIADDAVLAHENDLEGCLVVVKKNAKKPKNSPVVFVETLAHNRFLKYAPRAGGGVEKITLQGQRPLLFIEPKGHGIQAYREDQKDKDSVNGLMAYSFTGKAENPERASNRKVGYALLPIATTLWSRAEGKPNDTYGEAYEYKPLSVQIKEADGKIGEVRLQVGSLGAAFSGKVGASNMARPPWGWFDSSEREQPLGEWFFDPAKVIKRHFKLGEDFSTVYLSGIAVKISRHQK